MRSPIRPVGDDDNVEIIDGARRGMFALVAVAPLLLLGIGSRAAGAAAPACFNPNALPAGQKAMRTSLGFKLQSTDPKKKCGTCAFFKPAGGDCGKCDLLSGGPVATASICNSWAAKPQ